MRSFFIAQNVAANDANTIVDFSFQKTAIIDKITVLKLRYSNTFADLLDDILKAAKVSQDSMNFRNLSNLLFK